jgi:acetyl-CoA C-acetyltransferase
MPGSVIVGGARTPIGKLSGALKGFTAWSSAGSPSPRPWTQSGISGSQVDYVIMGHVIQAGAGQITARQAAVKGGIPMDVPALTVNKVCLSGLNAIAMADQLITVGEFDVVVAGGMESMTNGPYLLPGARSGYRYGDNKIIDATSHDALYCAFDLRGMGDSTDFYGKQQKITRAAQDEYSAMSHERAAEARKKGLFDDEIVNVTVPQRKGDPITVSEDEGVRPGTTAASLARLRPAFSADGTVTAGSASQISDGAAAVVVMSRAKAEELGAPILAEIGAHGSVAGRTRRCCRSRPTRSARRSGGPARQPATSPSTRSTRRSPRWRCSRCRTWGSTRATSTSTAARSPWATRSAPPAPGSRCTWPSSFAAAAVVSAPPASAAAAARARPFSCTSTLTRHTKA